MSGLSESKVTMLNAGQGSSSHYRSPTKFNWTCSRSGQQVLKNFDAICAAPFIKHAAYEAFSFDLISSEEWINVSEHIPQKPAEIWHFNQELTWWERQGDPVASKKYWKDLCEFLHYFGSHQCKLEVKLNHLVAAQHFNQRPSRTISIEINVQCRLSDIQWQDDPHLKQFKVHSFDEEQPTVVQLRKPHYLYQR